MRIKLLTFDKGTAEVQVGRAYSAGANLEDNIGIQVGKFGPIKSVEVDAPDDFFEKRSEYEVRKGKISRIKEKQ